MKTADKYTDAKNEKNLPERRTKETTNSQTKSAHPSIPQTEAVAWRKEYDVFICHAGEDKETVAKPLSEALRRSGLRVWYDEFELLLGDSLRRKIDSGLASSRYGVVILSKAFFRKEWPQKELDALVAREDGKDKVILPIWHGVNKQEIVTYSPLLADKVAVSTSRGLKKITGEILKVVSRDRARAAMEKEEHQRKYIPGRSRRFAPKPERMEPLIRHVKITGGTTLTIFVITLTIAYALVSRFLDPRAILFAPLTLMTHVILVMPLAQVLLEGKMKLTDVGICKGRGGVFEKLGVFSFIAGMATSIAYRVLILGKLPVIDKELNVGSVIVLTVIIPLTEELFFRGYLQGNMLPRLNRGQAQLVTSLLFLLSMVPRTLFYPSSVFNAVSIFGTLFTSNRDYSIPAYLFMSFFCSLVIGYIYERTRTLFYPLTVHTLLNISGLIRYY